MLKQLTGYITDVSFDFISEIVKFLLYDWDVCQIISPAVRLYYPVHFHSDSLKN